MSMNNLKHETVRRHLMLCIDNGICLGADTPQQWAEMMGYPVRQGNQHIVANHVASSGKEINAIFGRDVIAEYWPQWAQNSMYQTY